MNAVVKSEPIDNQPVSQPITAGESGAILSMIERAARDPSVDMEKFERLMAMRERLEMRSAQVAFAAAISGAKSEIEPATRNATGHNAKKYADFSAYAKVVDPVLAKHGLSYRFRSSQTGGISVTCIISHSGGHSEETTLSAGPDKTGNKNDIQAIGSALTYLQRYTLVLSLGLAASNDDDGKAAAGVPKITDDQIGELVELLESVDADQAKFLAYLKLEKLADIPAARFDEAVRLLERKASK